MCILSTCSTVDVILELAQTAVANACPNVRRGDKMDIKHYVKVNYVAIGFISS
jgi:hypothetical protein